jgi:hypothetical protein
MHAQQDVTGSLQRKHAAAVLLGAVGVTAVAATVMEMVEWYSSPQPWPSQVISLLH